MKPTLLRAHAWLGPLIGLGAVWGLFAVLNGADFIKLENQRLMLLQTAVVGAAAVGATVVIISGGIDLSVGTMIALSTVIVALLLRNGAPPTLAAAGAVLAAIACGAGIGAMVIGYVVPFAGAVLVALIAAWVAQTAGWIVGLATLLAGAPLAWWTLSRLTPRIPLNPFIVTLGLWGALRGAAKGLAGNQPVYPPATSWLNDLMSSTGRLLPAGVWWMLGLAALAAILLSLTRFGRHVFAVGSNEQAARLCGVAVERVKLLTYVIAAGCAGLAGLLQFSYLSMGDPTTAEGYELKVIAAVVIGGASLAGGEGGVLGALVGALIMTLVDNGCTKLGLDNWVQEIVAGAIIVAAVSLDRLRQRRS